MLYSKIPDHEKKFFATSTGIKNSKYELVEKSIAAFDYTKCTPLNLEKDYYIKQAIDKQAIILHNTRGYLRSDIYYLSNRGKVSVPFVLPRNGTILSMFSSKYWAYHMGPGAAGGNSNMSSKTLGIEICNIGPLIRNGDNLLTTYGDVYCKMTDAAEYHELSHPFRGYSYYATYTIGQYNALAKILPYLSTRYDISLDILPADERYSKFSDEYAKRYSGIASHVNYRDDLNDVGQFKKTDIGPGFEWDMLQSMLKCI